MNNQRFVPGFGARLKEERKRLRMSQEEFAAHCGIKRLAQAQYESEIREPRYSFLAAIAKLGLDLDYLFFGIRHMEKLISPEDVRTIELRVFHFIEEYATTKYGGDLSGEARHALFDVLRNYYINGAVAGRSSKEILADFGLKAIETITDPSPQALEPTKDSSPTS